MQWSPDRNAGFSRADPQQLYLPPIMDPVYGYEAVNIEAQSRDRSSLLNWMKRLLQVRRSSQAFGRGSLRFIRPGNRRVLVYLREYGTDTILCVANLARSAQPVELDLADYKGAVPIELLGRAPFPPIGELPYLLTLPGYAFYWFRLSREAEAPPWHDERAARDDLPVLVLIAGWSSFFAERVAPWRANLASALRTQLEGRVVAGFLATQRWAAPAGVVLGQVPAARGAGLAGATLTDWCLPQADLERWLVAIFEVHSGAQGGEYFVPLTIALEDADEARYRRLLPAALARARQHASTGVLADAAADEDFCRLVIDTIGSGRELATQLGRVRCTPTSAFAELRAAHSGELPLVPAGVQGTNTTVRIGDGFFLKIVRRVQPGNNAGVDVARYLTEVAHFPNSVPLAGFIEYQRANDAGSTLALLQGFVSNQGDGWDYTVNHLVRFLEERVAQPAAPAADAHGLYLALMHTLGTRTAQLHGVLAAAVDPTLAPEPITAEDLDTWRRSASEAATAALDRLAELLAQLPPATAATAATVLARREALLHSVAAAPTELPGALKIRCHGDYHLRQVLLRRNDFIITDAGATGQSVAAERRRCSPLADLATMLRSFAYARRMALQQCSLISANERERWGSQLDAWERETRSAFLSGYDETARASGLYASLAEVVPLLRLFELEDACADLQRELPGRPDWAAVPLRTLAALTA
jgi:maltose alpha-D-glucosyltransferase/alpha-amylase